MNCWKTYTKMHYIVTKVVFHLETTAFRLPASRLKKKKKISSLPKQQTSTLLIFYPSCHSIKHLKVQTLLTLEEVAMHWGAFTHISLSFHCLLCQQESCPIKGLKEKGLSYRQKVCQLSSHNLSWCVNTLY